MRVQVLYQPDCPHVDLMGQRVKEAIRSRPDILIEFTERPFDVLAVLGGSPTMLIDGLDPFDNGERSPEPRCRLYLTEAGLEGSPSIEQLRSAFAQTAPADHAKPPAAGPAA